MNSHAFGASKAVDRNLMAALSNPAIYLTEDAASASIRGFFSGAKVH